MARDTETVTISIKPPKLLLRMVERAAATAGENRHEWILGAIRARLTMAGDPLERLRAERAELVERLREVERLLAK